MPIYLAYEFQPRELTTRRLTIILNDLVDSFRLGGESYSSPEEFIEAMNRYYDRAIKFGIKPRNLLEKAAGFVYSVKEHPLLQLLFWSQREGLYSKYVPKKFKGISLNASHTGSEGIVDLIEFKPRMDGYLPWLGINCVDKSKLE